MRLRIAPPGIGQQTEATKALTAQLMAVGTRNGATRRRRKKRAAAAAPRARRRRAARGNGRLKKGSAAARAYMAKLRRMRRR